MANVLRQARNFTLGLYLKAVALFSRQENSTSEPPLSTEQRSIFETIENTNSHVFVTGKAGTGKSVVLRYFANNTHKTVIKVAPTGIAALNVNGQTIHSLFKFPTGYINLRTLTVSTETQQVLRYVDAIIIDEVSMVRADVIDGIDRALRVAKGTQVPFGGAQMVMFGDVYQLPPVVVGKELQRFFQAKYGGAYFFNAHVWKRAGLQTYELTQVFRQADSEFRDLLNVVRDGTHSRLTLDTLNARVIRPFDAPQNVVVLTSTNKAAQEINESRLRALRGKTKTYLAVTTGTVSESTFPTEERLTLRVGAQVIFVKNDPEGKWVNGTIGVIKSLKKDHIKVVCSNTTHVVVPAAWEQSEYVYDEGLDAMRQEVVGTFTQLPIKLAWAITIHKSQGCTYEQVVIDLRRGAFAHGQVYVALSRCRSLQGVYLLGPIRYRDVSVDPEVTAFMKRQSITPQGESDTVSI